MKLPADRARRVARASLRSPGRRVRPLATDTQRREVALARLPAARQAGDSAGTQLADWVARGPTGRCGIASFLTLQSVEWLARRFASLRLSITTVSIRDSAGRNTVEACWNDACRSALGPRFFQSKHGHGA